MRRLPILLVILSGEAAAADVIESTWTGGGGNVSWTTAANWSPAIVPQNNLASQFLVTIPSGSVTFGHASTGVWELNALTIGANANLTIAKPMNILGAAAVSGSIGAITAGVLTANSTAAQLIPPRGALSVGNGGAISFGATSYSSYGTASGGLVLNSEGAGSRITLPNLTLFDAGFDDGNVNSYSTLAIQARWNGVVDLPALTEFRGSLKRDDRLFLHTYSGGQLLLPAFSTLSTGFAECQFATSVSLPAAQTIRNTRFMLRGGSTLSAPNLTNLDHCGFSVSEGARFASVATTLNIGQIRPGPGEFGVYALFLDCYGPGSLIDLSSVQSINAAADGGIGGNVELSVHAREGGTIRLDGLQTITGSTQPGRLLRLILGGPGTLSMPALSHVTGRVVFHAEAGAAVALPGLQTATGAQFIISDDAALSAPLLTSIDNSTFRAEARASYATAAASYSGRTNPTTTTLFYGSNDSTLDLRSLLLIDAGFDDGNPGGTTHSISTWGGVIDLRNLQIILSPVRAEDRLRFLAQYGGVIRFSSLALPNATDLYLTYGGTFEVGGDFMLYPGASFSGDSSASPNSTALRVTGDCSVRTVTPGSTVALWYGAVAMVGSGVQTLEVCSRDNGNTTPSTFNPNWAIGLLQVGDNGRTTTVRLVDEVRNNPGFVPEALYLHYYNSDPATSLRIRAGSTLDLGTLNAYAKINGVMTPLRSLFPPGVTRVLFDQGWITIDPCYANCDGSTVVPVLNVNDFSCFLNRYAAGDPYANCDGSTIAPTLNVNDFACFVNRYAGGCP